MKRFVAATQAGGENHETAFELWTCLTESVCATASFFGVILPLYCCMLYNEGQGEVHGANFNDYFAFYYRHFCVKMFRSMEKN